MAVILVPGGSGRVARAAPPAQGVSASVGVSASGGAGVSVSEGAGAAKSAAWFELGSVKKVLHVGDSEVGYAAGLCKDMRARFEAQHVEYHSDSWTSAGLKTVVDEDKLDRFLVKYDPDLVLLNLGTNNLGYPNAAPLAPLVKKVVAKIGSRRCVWIGPPHLPSGEKTEANVVRMIAENAAPCRFFDSQALDLSLQPDKIHPDGRGAQRWAANLWPVLFEGKEMPGPFRQIASK